MKSAISPKILDEARRFLADKEKLLHTLRNRGLSKSDSIAAYAELYDMTLARSKVDVHFSETWKDARKTDEKLHESVFAALDRHPEPPRRPRRRIS